MFFLVTLYFPWFNLKQACYYKQLSKQLKGLKYQIFLVNRYFRDKNEENTIKSIKFLKTKAFVE